MIHVAPPMNAGPRWGKYYVGPIQFLVCYGAVVACTLLGGQSLKVVPASSPTVRPVLRASYPHGADHIVLRCQ